MPEPTRTPASTEDGPGAQICRVMDALSFAASAHANHRRKGATQEPYINHLIEVSELVSVATAGQDLPAILAALLHDVIEDTGTSEADLATRFGKEVAVIVAENSDDLTLPKPERQLARIAAAPHKSPSARLVKTADMISNLRAIAKSPPAGWGPSRQLAYLNACRAMAAAIRGSNPGLERLFEETADQTEYTIRARMNAESATSATVARLDAEIGQPVHLIYLANTEHGPIGEAEIDRLCHLIAQTFPSAVVHQADAIYEGIRRPVIVARIRTDATEAVVALAQQLCLAFAQRFVGLEIDGRYLRIYSDDTA